MRRKLSKKDRLRRREIINELSRMSRDGWKNATADEYKPLERELIEIQTRLWSQPRN